MPVYRLKKIEGFLMENGEVFCHDCFQDNGDAIDMVFTVQDLQDDEQLLFICDGCKRELPIDQ